MTASATQDPATVLTLLLVAAIVLPLLVVAYALSKSRRKNQALTAAYQGAVQDYHEAYRAAGNAHRAAEAARADLERSKANAAQALEQQQLNHDQELQALRDQLAPLGPEIVKKALGRQTPADVGEFIRKNFIRAMREGDFATVYHMVDNVGISVNYEDAYGNTALICAARYGLKVPIEQLLYRGADVCARPVETAAAVWQLARLR